jgi:uncharacterized protein DUF4386
MNSDKSTGRMVGVLMLVHILVGLMVPFIILDPIIAHGEFLAKAAPAAGAVRTAVFLLFVGSAMEIAIAATAWPVLREYSKRMALWLFALGVASFTLQAVDNAHILAMLSLSQQAAGAAAAKAEMFQALALVVGAARKWSHYSYLFVAVVWIFLLFVTLCRFRLAPRWLAILGALAAGLQIGAVCVRGMLGYPPAMRLAIPLGPMYVLVAVWLMVKGFSVQQPQATTT